MSWSPRIPRFLVAALALAIFGTATMAGPVPQALGATTPHLVLIIMENKEYTDVVGSTAAPYINGTLIPDSMVFMRHYAADHPSLPNYLVLTSTTAEGCVDDTCPVGFHTGKNLFRQLDTAGISWKGYMGGMPSNCYPSNTGTYLVRHNPPLYYADLAGGSCAAKDVPLTRLAADLASGGLPSFSLISPNKYDSMHSNQNAPGCQLGSITMNELCQGDRWLSQTIPSLLDLNADGDPNNNVTVVLTFDEGSTSQGGGGRVLTLVTGPNVTPGQDARVYSHEGLLNAIEGWFGVPKLHPAVEPL